MNVVFTELKEFVLPKWEELPLKRMYGEEICAFVNQLMAPLHNEKIHLTPTMIQNYLKWNLLPPIKGRKYEREHLAWCICITLYKRILPIKDVAKGITLQQNFMNVAEAYDCLAEFINQGFGTMFNSLANNDGQIVLPNLPANVQYVSLALSAQTFVFQCFLDYIVQSGGVEAGGLLTSTLAKVE